MWKITSKTDEKVQEKAVIGLIERLLQKRVAEFSIHVNQSLLQADNKDKFIVRSNLWDEFITEFFQIESIEQNKIKITGSSGVAAANGFHYFLKYCVKSHVSWSGDQLNVPNPLPVIKRQIKITIQDKY